MKIICNTEQLKKYTQIVLRCVSKNNTLPILTSIRVKTDGKFLVMESTNLSIGVSCRFPVEVVEEGEVVINANIFDSSINNLKDKNIEIHFDKGNLKIRSSQNNITIKGEDKDDFPILPKIENQENILMKTDVLVSGIKNVVWATSISDIKPELSSVYVYTQDENLCFVATDSFRLAEMKVKSKKPIDNFSVLIPYKNAIEIAKILENFDDDVEIGFTKNQICFKIGGVYLISRLIDGVFPDYKQIIPKENTTEIIVLKKELQDMLKIAQVFSDKFNHLSININKENKECEFISKNSDIGEQTSKLKTTITGNSVSVNINLRYLLDTMNIINEDSISFSILNPQKPIVVRGVSNKLYTYLLMPMNR